MIVKRRHYSKYRPKKYPSFISKAHFKQLVKYWNTSTIQVKLFHVLFSHYHNVEH